MNLGFRRGDTTPWIEDDPGLREVMLDKCFNVDFVFDMGFDRRFNSLQNLFTENCPHPDDIDDSLVDDYSLLYQADTEMESISCLHLDDIGDSMLDDYILLHEVHCGKHKLSTVVWFCLGKSWRQSTIRKTNITILHLEGPSIPLPHFMEMSCFSKVEYTFVLLYGATQTLSRVIIETCEAGRV